MAKGADFEREVCRDLTEWLTGKRDPVLFWRSAGSGNQATMAYKKGKESNMDGDIMAVDSKGSFFTECFCIDTKWYKTFTFDVLLEDHKMEISAFLKSLETSKKTPKGKPTILYWWHKLKYEAERAGKIPLLILRKNRFNPIICILPSEIAYHLPLGHPYFDTQDALGNLVTIALWKNFWNGAIGKKHITNLMEKK